MVAATAVTLLSLPVYAVLYRWQGAMGLAVASNLGIALQTVTLAVLLHSRRMVSLASIDYAEMGRCLLAGGAGGGAVWGVFTWGGEKMGSRLGPHLPAHSHWTDLAILLAGTALWLLVAQWVLQKSGSALPRVMKKRMGLG